MATQGVQYMGERGPSLVGSLGYYPFNKCLWPSPSNITFLSVSLYRTSIIKKSTEMFWTIAMAVLQHILCKLRFLFVCPNFGLIWHAHWAVWLDTDWWVGGGDPWLYSLYKTLKKKISSCSCCSTGCQCILCWDNNSKVLLKTFFSRQCCALVKKYWVWHLFVLLHWLSKHPLLGQHLYSTFDKT